MVEVVKSATFDRWLKGIRDRKAAARIQVRMDGLAEQATRGDVRPVGAGVSELRLDYDRAIGSTTCRKGSV